VTDLGKKKKKGEPERDHGENSKGGTNRVGQEKCRHKNNRGSRQNEKNRPDVETGRKKKGKKTEKLKKNYVKRPFDLGNFTQTGDSTM